MANRRGADFLERKTIEKISQNMNFLLSFVADRNIGELDAVPFLLRLGSNEYGHTKENKG